jgi:spectinomycin phosphotransferase
MLDAGAEPLGDLGAMDDRSDVVGLLVQLHAATPLVRSLATRRELQVAGRAELERTLQELDDPWTAGPFSERARAAVARDPERIARLLGQFDRLAAEVAASPGDLVITHGEPHGRNIIRAYGELLLVDWDTVALAPPERDLWMVDDGSGDALEEYADATGRKVRQSAIDLYRLGWDLDEVAAYTSRLRGEHRENADSEASAGFLEEYVRLLPRWDSLV